MSEIDFDVHLQLWDTAGQERFQVGFNFEKFINFKKLKSKSITRQYFRNAAAVVIFFDSSTENGIDSAENWADRVVDEINENMTLIFVANKVDLGQVISDEAGIMLADKFNGHYLKNSSKVGTYQMKIIKLLTVGTTVLSQNINSFSAIWLKTISN